jgi:hypothetical protein
MDYDRALNECIAVGTKLACSEPNFRGLREIHGIVDGASVPEVPSKDATRHAAEPAVAPAASQDRQQGDDEYKIHASSQTPAAGSNKTTPARAATSPDNI